MHLGYRFLFLSKSSVAELNYSAFQAKSAVFCFFVGLIGYGHKVCQRPLEVGCGHGCRELGERR